MLIIPSFSHTGPHSYFITLHISSFSSFLHLLPLTSSMYSPSTITRQYTKGNLESSLHQMLLDTPSLVESLPPLLEQGIFKVTSHGLKRSQGVQHLSSYLEEPLLKQQKVTHCPTSSIVQNPVTSRSLVDYQEAIKKEAGGQQNSGTILNLMQNQVISMPSQVNSSLPSIPQLSELLQTLLKDPVTVRNLITTGFTGRQVLAKVEELVNYIQTHTRSQGLSGGVDINKKNQSSSMTLIPSALVSEDSSKIGVITTHSLLKSNVDQSLFALPPSSSRLSISQKPSGQILKQSQQLDEDLNLHTLMTPSYNSDWDLYEQSYDSEYVFSSPSIGSYYNPIEVSDDEVPMLIPI